MKKKKRKAGKGGRKGRFESAFICMKEHWKVILGNNESGWGQRTGWTGTGVIFPSVFLFMSLCSLKKKKNFKILTVDSGNGNRCALHPVFPGAPVLRHRNVAPAVGH